MDFDHRAPPLAPPPRSDGDLEGRPLLTPPWKKRRSSADPHTPILEPPKNRARSCMFDGASVADNVLTGAFPTPPPRKNQFGGPFDLHPQRRACLFAPPPPPPRRRAFFGPFDGCEYGDEDKRSASFPAPPPPPPRRPAFFNPFEGCQDCDDGERTSSFPAPPPPRGPALIDLTEDGDDGEPSASFPAPPPPKGPAFVDLTDVVDDEDGDGGEPSASFPAPPQPKGPAFVDLTDVVDDEDGDDDGSATIVIHPGPAPTRQASGPFEPVTLLQPRDGGRSSSRGRGRGRGRGVCGGRGRGVAAGPGSRARALAELIGDREPVLTPDGGPAPGQDLEEWELLRDLALITEYEYLDGLLRRLKKLPKRARINATEREGWTVFYTGLETCLVVRKQMLKAKCNPTPVPDQLLAEVR